MIKTSAMSLERQKMHGGRILEYSKDGKNLIDFSASINPYGLDNNLKEILKESISLLVHYPNENFDEIKALISQKHGVDKYSIYIGNGANSIIFRLFQTFGKGINICIPVPSFESYRLAAESVDGNIIYYNMPNFKIKEDIFDILSDDIDVLVLTNPNNPTGFMVDDSLLCRIIGHCRSRNIFVLLDECFLEFLVDGEKSSQIKNLLAFNNIAMLRSLTKLYAFPGLRFGYLITNNSHIIRKLEKLTPSWDINTLALVAAKYSLSQNMVNVIDGIQEEKSILEINLRSIGITVFPSLANFILCKYNKNLSDDLLKEGIIVRDCSDFIGLDNTYFRVGVRTKAENLILFEAIKKLVKEQNI